MKAEEFNKIKIGDIVHFKLDYEGTGEVIDIINLEQRGIFWDGSVLLKRLVLKSPGEPSGYRWHIASNYDHEYGCEVVVVGDFNTFHREKPFAVWRDSDGWAYMHDVKNRYTVGDMGYDYIFTMSDVKKVCKKYDIDIDDVDIRIQLIQEHGDEIND